MGVKVRDHKGDGKAWIIIHDKRLPNRRAKVYVGDDWDAAHEAASRIRVKIAAGDFTFLVARDGQAPGRLTLSKAVDDWMEHRRAFRATEASTMANYKALLDKHVMPELGARPVAAIRRNDLVRLFRDLLNGVARSCAIRREKGREIAITPRPLSKAVCRNLLAPIRQTYERLTEDEHMAIQNPAVRFGKLLAERVDKRKHVKPLSADDQVKILEAARKYAPRYHALFLLAFRAGLRLSELFGLKWADIEWANRRVRVERQFRDGQEVDRTKKNKVRDVDLSADCIAALLAHKKAYGSIPWVFTTKRGQPIKSRSSFRKNVTLRLARLAGLKRHVKFQHLRQTFGTDLNEATGNLLYVSEQLGHASIKVTSDYYATSRNGKAGVDALDKRIRAARRGRKVGGA